MDLFKNFELQLQSLVPTPDQIRKQTPEFLNQKIDQVINLFKNEITRNRRIYLEKVKAFEGSDQSEEIPTHIGTWETFKQRIEISFGKWSNGFNKVLRERIKITDKDKTAKKLAETKKLNLVFLFWTKQKNFILAFNTSDITPKIKMLGILSLEMQQIEKIMVDTKPENYEAIALHYLKKSKEE